MGSAVRTIILIVGFASWIFVLVTSSIKLINSHFDKVFGQGFKGQDD